MSSTLHQGEQIEETEWQPPGPPVHAEHQPQDVGQAPQRRKRGAQPGSTRMKLTRDGDFKIGVPQPIALEEIRSSWQPGQREELLEALSALQVGFYLPVYSAPSLAAIHRVTEDWRNGRTDGWRYNFSVVPHTEPDGSVIAHIIRSTNRMTQPKTGAVRRGRGRPARHALSGTSD